MAAYRNLAERVSAVYPRSVPSPTTVHWVSPAEAVEPRCPACLTGSGERFLSVAPAGQAISQAGSVDVARCASCDSVWFPGLVIDDSYPRAEDQPIDDGFRLLVDHYVELVAGLDWKVRLLSLLPEGWRPQRVLEVGCNVGVLLDYVSRVWGAEVVGLEPSAYGVAGRARFGVPIVSEYMHEHRERGGRSYDLAIATEVIEHVDSPLEFLRELRQLVTPTGLVVLTTPDAAGVAAERSPGELYAMLSIGSHRMLLSERRLREIAQAAGFPSVWIERHPTTLVAILGGQPAELRRAAEHLPRLVEYHDHRLGDPSLRGRRDRVRLADLIARYVAARSLGTHDGSRGEGEIDDLLRELFDIDVRDLAGVVERADAARTIFEFGRVAPFSLSSYLFYRGHRDDLSERQRTEAWEVAVALIGRGMAIEPVNLFVLEFGLGGLLRALAGRPAERFRYAARAALASAPELASRDLPFVLHPLARRVKRTIRRILSG